MNITRKVRIIGIGTYLPPNKISSEQLEIKLGLSKGYSLKYSGVSERYHVEDDSVASMGAKAVSRALDDSGVALNDIDLILCAGVSFDYILPNRASGLLAELKSGGDCNIPTLDINNSCLSFVSGFELAGYLLNSGQYKRILLVTSEIASKHLDLACKEVATLFGDAATALILEYDGDTESHIIHSSTKTYVEGIEFSIIKGGGIKYPVKDYPYNPKLYSFQMNGRNLLKLAHRIIPDFFKGFLSDSGLDANEVDLIIPHQASKMGLKMFEKIMPFRKDKLFCNLHKYGNCISSSIPLALCEAIREKKIMRGDKVLLAGTAAGVSIGALLFKY